jgi:type II secretory pathway pseudopilin PulG
MSKAVRLVKPEQVKLMARFKSCLLLSIRLQQGFSYLGVLILVAWMGVTLLATAEISATATRREREQELLAQGHQFRQAIARYYETLTTAGQHEYPASLDDLLQDTRSPGVRRYLRKVFTDPMTAKPEWGLVKVAGRIVGVHSLSNQKPIKQDGFEPEDAALRHQSRYAQWVFTYPSDLALPGEDAASAASQK